MPNGLQEKKWRKAQLMEALKNNYELQKKQFIESGAVEADPPVSDYVLFDNMIKAGEY